jgi:hypothetical protein
MGYTHSWNRPQIINPETFQAIGKDFLHILPTVEALGAPLANSWGHEEPEIGPEFIGFNGVHHCGHTKNTAIRLPWPAPDAKGIGSNEGLTGTLPHRTCNGDCSYESFWFRRSLQSDDPTYMPDSFCKTNFRPYDLAVTAFLVIAKHHLRDEITVETDGDHPQWEDAFELCQGELDYGSEFHIVRVGTTRTLREAVCE